jgi:crotonobetaine/carnitine-CoA ligase
MINIGEAVERGTQLAHQLLNEGFRPGARLAIIERSTTDYLLFWVAAQLAGMETALVNPSYPEELIVAMLHQLQPVATASQRAIGVGSVRHISYTDCRTGDLKVNGERARVRTLDVLPGLERDPLDTAGYMHTSGTSGIPKFCSQSHSYFLRLGRLVQDALGLTAADRVYAPLPLFHINPLGYGLIGALTAGADFIGSFLEDSGISQRLGVDNACSSAGYPSKAIDTQRR